MRVLRLNGRTLLLIIAEAVLVYGAIIAAVYVRVGTEGAAYELIERHGYWKAAVAGFFCLASFYLFDLYDFLVMHDRRELVLRLVQALGLAWIGLALAFYLSPGLRLGRGRCSAWSSSATTLNGSEAKRGPSHRRWDSSGTTWKLTQL